jgi:uncharacterized protein (DUF433 family)
MVMQAGIIECGWGPVIAGTRITIFDVLHYLEASRKPEEIAEILSLSLNQINDAIQYINEHKAEVMAIHREIEESIARGNPPEVQAKLDAASARSRARIMQRQLQRSQERNGARDSGRS